MSADREETPVTAGDVVRFVHVDPIFGTPLEGIGIVVKVDEDQVVIAPVAGYALTVPAADVQPADQLADGDEVSS